MPIRLFMSCHSIPFHICNWLLFNSGQHLDVDQWGVGDGYCPTGLTHSHEKRTKQQMAQHLHWSTTDTIFNKSKVIYVTVAGQGYFNRNVIEKCRGCCWWRHSALYARWGWCDQRTSRNKSISSRHTRNRTKAVHSHFNCTNCAQCPL